MTTFRIGVDEAGRGAVIGPLVVAGVSFHEDKLGEISTYLKKDSKGYTSNKRIELYKNITRDAEYIKYILIGPAEINDEMERGINLNFIELRRVSEIIIDILEKINSDRVQITIDSMTSRSIQCKTYIIDKIMQTNLHKRTSVLCEHRADEKYIETAAASIIAKVVRDREIEKLRKKLGDFGSGYPSDPKTRHFLIKVLKNRCGADIDLYKLIRLKWKTVKKIIGD